MTTQPFEVHVSDSRYFTLTNPAPVLDFEHGDGDYLWVATQDEGRLVMVEPIEVNVCQGLTCTVPDCVVRKDFEENAAAVGEDLSYRDGYLELQRTLASNNLVLNDIYDKLIALYPGSPELTRTIGELLAVVLADFREYKRIADTLLPPAQRWREYIEVTAEPNLGEAIAALPQAHASLWAAVYTAEGQSLPKLSRTTTQESHHGPPFGFSTNPAPNPRQG